jgi:hypothetical protein
MLLLSVTVICARTPTHQRDVAETDFFFILFALLRKCLAPPFEVLFNSVAGVESHHAVFGLRKSSRRAKNLVVHWMVFDGRGFTFWRVSTYSDPVYTWPVTGGGYSLTGQGPKTRES